jgi:hypothetical protein
MMSRPKTATNREKSAFNFPQSQSRADLKDNAFKISRPTTAFNKLKTMNSKFSESMKTLKSESSQNFQTQASETQPKKQHKQGLLLKQRKLFTAAKTSSMAAIVGSGFNYFEADVNVKDDYGNSPLFYAARNGNKEICDFLLAHKARVNESCANGNSPLHMAFASNNAMVIF